MSMHQNQGAITAERVYAKMVEAGKMAAFTVHWESGAKNIPVSLRAAVWFLQCLEGKIEAHDPEAVADWRAVPISYQYGTHKAVLGTYYIDELEDFLRGRAAYTKRKWKDAERRMRRAQRVLAQKGGAAL